MGNIFPTKNRAIASAVEGNMNDEDIEKLKKFQPSLEDKIKEVNSFEEAGALSYQDDSMDSSFVGEQNTLDENVYNDEQEEHSTQDDYQNVIRNDHEVMHIENDDEVRPC